MRIILILLLLILVFISNNFIFQYYSNIKITIIGVLAISIIFGLLFERIISYKRRKYSKEYNELLITTKKITQQMDNDFKSLEKRALLSKDMKDKIDIKFNELNELVKKLENEEYIDIKNLNKIKIDIEKLKELNIDKEDLDKINIIIEDIHEMTNDIKIQQDKLGTELNSRELERVKITHQIDLINNNLDELNTLKTLIAESRTFNGIIKDLISF